MTTLTLFCFFVLERYLSIFQIKKSLTFVLVFILIVLLCTFLSLESYEKEQNQLIIQM